VLRLPISLRLPKRPALCSAANPEVPQTLPTLRRELIGAVAIVFSGALFVAAAGIVFVVPRLDPLLAAIWIVILLLADIALFSWLGALLLQRRLLKPLNELVACVESISEGAYETRLPVADTRELARLGLAVSHMAHRLLADRQTLADNIRSLDETNRLLTEARDAMIQAEKMASVGRLGAGIAHEVGNPLSAILGYLGLLARREDYPSRELVLAAEREARRIDRIVRGLLDYARPREAAIQQVDVESVIADTVDLVRTQGHFAHAILDVDVGGTLFVEGDPYQLQQIFVNLLVNAADAVADQADARIGIMARRRPARPAPLHRPARRKGDPAGVDYSHRRRLAVPARFRTGDPPSETGDVIAIDVIDNGPGLPQELIDQIFEPFVTTKEPGKGTGLGLALCVRLIEGMGGTISGANTEAGGAIFTVVLPAVDAAPAVADESRLASPDVPQQA
jgi:two-component system, NtrC family, sensor kinase